MTFRTVSRVSVRSFSTSLTRPSFARLTMAGNLVDAPKKQTNKNGKEYWLFKVATNDPSGPPSADGTFPDRTSSFHNIISYSNTDKEAYANIPKGSLVHIDAAYSKKSEKQADDTYKETTFLNMRTLEVLKRNTPKSEEGSAYQ